MLRILLGVVIGVVLVPLAVMGWFKFGHPPVAVADKPLPFERNISRCSYARTHRQPVG